MGKKSIKENKNIYFASREDAGLTRAQASERIGYISESRIEKIENEKAAVQPEDVVAMAAAYKRPELCNYYCTHECMIGRDLVPEVKISTLSEITLGVLSSLNALQRQKDRLIDITEDSQVDPAELPDFMQILDQLEKISLTADSLKLWLSSQIAEGRIDQSVVDRLKKK